jgi:serine/threonine-protein kinase
VTLPTARAGANAPPLRIDPLLCAPDEPTRRESCPGWYEIVIPPATQGPPKTYPTYGSMLPGGYRLAAALGRGGMGTVFRATSPRGAHVAVKILHWQLAEDPETRARFIAEARAMARIEHANVMQLLDADEDGPLPFFVMPHVDGPDVRTFIKHTGPRGVPLHRALGILSAIAGGLAAIHAAGVVHHDIKPANVMLDPVRVAVVCDFGLAMPWGGSCRRTPGEFMGTPGYAAPELVHGRTVVPNPASDIYGLGALAFELLTGTPLFSSEETADLLTACVTEPARAPSERRPDVPPVLDHVVLAALSRTIHARPGANDFRAVVERVRRETVPVRRNLRARPLGPEAPPHSRF